MEKKDVIYAENSLGEILESHLEEYLGKSGVWALYGRNEANEEICLQVGKCVDVGNEILYDIGCMHYLKIREDGDRKYINQFKEDCGFYYKMGQTQEYLYPTIAKKYDSIKFVIIADKSDIDIKINYANKEHAIYWRNGGAYEAVEQNNRKWSAKLRIDELFPNGGEVYTIDELINILCTEFGYDKIYAVRVLNEMEKENFIIHASDNCYTR